LRVPDVRERWRSGWFEATAYDWVVEQERLAQLLGWLIWGMDAPSFYREIARIGQEPEGTAVLDIPCGGGVAFRGLQPARRLRYVAADLSPVMLGRAHAEAERRGIDWIEFAEADVESLPFEDGSFDLCVSFTGLHCFPNPAAAIAEMARVLRPGGELRGTAVIKRAGARQDAFVRLMQLGGVFGPSGTLAELESWLVAAGLVRVSARRDGALAYFSAHQPSGTG
jgi:ubiquinone/menaquinone biosynthesis C-methylase UbiE